MAGKKNNDRNKVSKEEVTDVVNLLTEALGKFKEVIGEKKFEKRVRKAARLLLEGVRKDRETAAPGKDVAKGTAVKKSSAATKKLPSKGRSIAKVAVKAEKIAVKSPAKKIAGKTKTGS